MPKKKETVLREDNLILEDIKAQYNPKRFKFWKSLHVGPEEHVLDLEYSPHYRFLVQYDVENEKLGKWCKDTPYFKMHSLYGRDKLWIYAKISTFIELFESMKTTGFKGRISVVETPVHKNVYNSGYEIYEGHHRGASCLYIGARTIPVYVVEPPR